MTGGSGKSTGAVPKNGKSGAEGVDLSIQDAQNISNLVGSDPPAGDPGVSNEVVVVPPTIEEVTTANQLLADSDKSETGALYLRFNKAMGEKYLANLKAYNEELKNEADKSKEEEEEKKRLEALRSSLFPEGKFTGEGLNMLRSQLGSLSDNIGSILMGVNCFRYEGFDPSKLIVRICSSQLVVKKLCTDLIFFMGLLFLRGTNVSAMLKKCSANDTQKARLTALVATYNLKDRSSADPMAITLPRISLCFPTLALTVWKAATERNVIVTVNEIGVDYLILAHGFSMAGVNSISGASTTDDKVFFIHTVYQAFITQKTTRSKMIEDKHLNDSVKYSKITVEQKTESIDIELSPTEEECQTVIFKLLNKTSRVVKFDDPITYYHRLFNRCQDEYVNTKDKVFTLLDVVTVKGKMDA